MRIEKLFGRTSLLGAAVASLLVGALAASCTFDPGPAGSSSGVPGQPGTGMTGNPFAAHSGQTGGGGGGTGTGTGPGLDGPNCGSSKYGLENVPPDLLIVLDRSGSMDHDYADKTCGMGACVRKWPDMVTGLNQVVSATTATIRWGLKYFPDGNNACGVGPGAVVTPGANSGGAVMTSLSMTQPGANARTPTALGVTNGATYLKGLADPNPKYILLATDGLPNCGGGNAGTEDGPGAEAAVLASAMAGIPVYVVGIGNVDEAVTTLNNMAVKGGRPRNDPTTKYYPVTSTADLVSILTMIGGQIASCTFSLGKVPPVPTNIAVYGDNVRIAQDTTHVNGWDYGPGMMSVELFGATCDAVKNKTTTSVQAIFGCPGEIIP
jgi:hypothetical protein